MTTTDDRPVTRTVDDLDQPARQWWTRAACSGTDAEVFLEPSQASTAKDICSACPVARDCLLDAIRQPEDVSVRGGKTRRERRAWLQAQGVGQPTEVDWNVVRRMVAAGVGWDHIGAVYGISANTMQKRWTRANQPPAQRRTGPAAEDVDTDRARRLHDDGMLWKDVALTLGTSQTTLWRALARDDQGKATS